MVAKMFRKVFGATQPLMFHGSRTSAFHRGRGVKVVFKKKHIFHPSSKINYI